MKEIIAERDKSSFWFITGVGAISLIGSIIGLFSIPRFFSFYIFGIICMSFITIVGAIGLCLPKWVILKENDTLIILNAFRSFKKRKIKINDVVEARVQPLPQQFQEKQNGNIILKIRMKENETKDILIINIKNKSDAIEKLNLLVKNKIEH